MNKLEKVGKGLVNLEFPNSTIKKLNKMFFDFCREHNIKQGTPIKRKGKVIGYRQANYDWTIAHDFFLNRLRDAIQLSILFDDVPKDLKG